MYYAYYLIDDNKKGIADNWEDCQKVCENKGARYKKFKTINEAQDWLDSGANYEAKEKDVSMLRKDAVYFDAGTGRGNGVEIRISDIHSNSLLYFVLPVEKINEFGNYYLDSHRTNNYGELTALYAALLYANKYNVKYIMGDSQLVIEYWSKGIYKNDIDEETIKLIKKVTKIREKFEQSGGVIEKISGDVNPADLGFHK